MRTLRYFSRSAAGLDHESCATNVAGVHEMPAEAHRMGGKRLAEHGYLMTKEVAK